MKEHAERPGKYYDGIERDSDTKKFHGPDDTADANHDGKLDSKPGLGRDKE